MLQGSAHDIHAVKLGDVPPHEARHIVNGDAGRFHIIDIRRRAAEAQGLPVILAVAIRLTVDKRLEALAAKGLKESLDHLRSEREAQKPCAAVHILDACAI